MKIDYSMNCIVPVRLSVVKKGAPKRFAIICLATVKDLKCEPVESAREDQNQLIRKQIRTDHRCLLKKLKRKRKAAKEIEKASM